MKEKETNRKEESPLDIHYISAPQPMADEQVRVLKNNDTFAIFDHYGDIRPVGLGEEGLFHQGTRFLSCLCLKLGRYRPLFLSSGVTEDNRLLTADLTNPDVYLDKDVLIPRGTLHILRTKFLHSGCCYEKISIRNFGLTPIAGSFSIQFHSDFADIFEVRGSSRARRGTLLGQKQEGGAILLQYEGIDKQVRTTRLSFSPLPREIAPGELYFEVELKPQEESSFVLIVACEPTATPTDLVSFESALGRVRSRVAQFRDSAISFHSSNEQFNDWAKRSLSDLHMMVTDLPSGLYPYAGVPWFSTEFGRDGILTAFECLWHWPELARGVLSYLAATQATEVSHEQDAEPGKILHEARGGEMAALKEIPFGRYYGSVDSTPLFVWLAGHYYDRTGDLEFIDSLWPQIEKALHWIDQFGDKDGDGFVEYHRESEQGLVNQGWKDSHDSVFHADGSLATGPIALCEVQAYVYGAKQGAAELAALLGHADLSVELMNQCRRLQERFEEAFWCEDLSTYAIALDGEKRPCRVKSSNAGQCLMTKLVRPDRAKRVANELLKESCFTGFGVRTIARGESRYNPMSYHNGSIWPHDNALIAYGMTQYHLNTHALKIFSGLFDASLWMDLHRMPELFCGFFRRADEGPTLYPVACAPQSWSAASVFLLLQACLGIKFNAAEGRLSFNYPSLPESIKELTIENLRLGDSSVDLLLRRVGADVAVNVIRREGKIEITLRK